MKTPEEIAKAAAETVVTVKVGDDGRYRLSSSFVLPDGFGLSWQDSTLAGKAAGNHRAPLAAIILAAIEEARSQCPAPSPVSNEELQAVWRWADGIHRAPSAKERYRLLRQHIDFLHRIMNGSEASAYAAGYDAGRAQRVSGRDPREDVRCGWCAALTRTTVHEIPSDANAEGRLVRLCEGCAGGCAGG